MKKWREKRRKRDDSSQEFGGFHKTDSVYSYCENSVDVVSNLRTSAVSFNAVDRQISQAFNDMVSMLDRF